MGTTEKLKFKNKEIKYECKGVITIPRNPTIKVLRRKDEVYRLVLERGEVSTAEIANAMNLTLSQAYYTLKLLSKEGKLNSERKGKASYWRPV
ncbi:MAG: DNA-binding protein [Thermoprotei archaeon]|nr:MAG: DNA-binding protein [Thermoprotei archaeon]